MCVRACVHAHARASVRMCACVYVLLRVRMQCVYVRACACMRAHAHAHVCVPRVHAYAFCARVRTLACVRAFVLSRMRECNAAVDSGPQTAAAALQARMSDSNPQIGLPASIRLPPRRRRKRTRLGLPNSDIRWSAWVAPAGQVKSASI